MNYWDIKKLVDKLVKDHEKSKKRYRTLGGKYV